MILITLQTNDLIKLQAIEDLRMRLAVMCTCIILPPQSNNAVCAFKITRRVLPFALERSLRN